MSYHLTNTIVCGIFTAPFLIVLIWRESIAARLCLFVTNTITYVIVILLGLIIAIMLVGVAGQLVEAGEKEAQGSDQQNALNAIAILCTAAATFIGVYTIIFGLLYALVLYVYWKFYTNLRDRAKA